MPPNTIYVGRPTRWGNPYRGDNQFVVSLFENHLKQMKRLEPASYHELVAPLRGKNLACWCPLDRPCHADVLLQLANA